MFNSIVLLLLLSTLLITCSAHLPSSFVITPNQTIYESRWIMGDLYHFLTPPSNHIHAVTIMVSLYPFPAGQGHPPFHEHSNEDEEFYIVDGEIHFLINDDPVPKVYGAGTYLYQPRGTKHTFWVDESQGRPSRMLAFITPTGLDQVFRDKGVPAYNLTLSDTPSPVLPSPDQMNAFLQGVQQHGVILYSPTAETTSTGHQDL